MPTFTMVILMAHVVARIPKRCKLLYRAAMLKLTTIITTMAMPMATTMTIITMGTMTMITMGMLTMNLASITSITDTLHMATSMLICKGFFCTSWLTRWALWE